MCYTIYLSTTSGEDLSDLNDGPFFFYRPSEHDDPDMLALLEHPSRWYLGSQYGGCSCHFRHVQMDREPEFVPPEDWCPEDEDDIEATKAVYDVLSRIVSEGHKLDLLSIWEGCSPDAVKAARFSLSEVPRESFRFFEDYRFVVSP